MSLARKLRRVNIKEKAKFADSAMKTGIRIGALAERQRITQAAFNLKYVEEVRRVTGITRRDERETNP